MYKNIKQQTKVPIVTHTLPQKNKLWQKIDFGLAKMQSEKGVQKNSTYPYLSEMVLNQNLFELFLKKLTGLTFVFMAYFNYCS